MRGEVVLIFLSVAVLVLILVALYLRYRNLQLFHQERMVAIEKGTPVPVGHVLAPWSPRLYLLRGLLWSFAGVALTISLIGIAVSTHRQESAESVLWRANNMVRNLNISLEEAKKIAEKDARQNGMPTSLCLLGLIPIGVGMAYLVFYYTGDKRQQDEA